MLKVFICEDNVHQRDKVRELVENSIIRQKLDMEIVAVTGEYSEILKGAEKTGDDSLFFLDIDLKDKINGIRLGQMLRDKYANCFIVFVTTHSEMSFLTFEYKVEALDFILKDNMETFKARVDECIKKAYQRYLKREKDIKLFKIETDESIINVRYSDVLFFETSISPHKIRLHEINRQIDFYGTLKEIESQLDKRFYRCHKAYIVNIDNIKEIDKSKRIIRMINGEECDVSFRYLSGLTKLIS